MTEQAHAQTSTKHERNFPQRRNEHLIPPTKAALEEHIKRVSYQGGHVWDLIPPTKAALEEHVKKAALEEHVKKATYQGGHVLGLIPPTKAALEEHVKKAALEEHVKKVAYQGGHVWVLIPPAKIALEEHVKRRTYQGGHVWGQTLVPAPKLPPPTSWGWTMKMGCTIYTGLDYQRQPRPAMN